MKTCNSQDFTAFLFFGIPGKAISGALALAEQRLASVRLNIAMTALPACSIFSSNVEKSISNVDLFISDVDFSTSIVILLFLFQAVFRGKKTGGDVCEEILNGEDVTYSGSLEHISFSVSHSVSFGN